jgi:shikimate dehydrogenase
MTERVGLLGWPVGHSLSPVMHNAAFEALSLDWRYDLLPVSPEKLEAEVTRLIEQEGYRGFNVTIPHKRAALRLPQMSETTLAAEIVGAANTLAVQADGRLYADNTDWCGFLDDLCAHQVGVAGQQCLVLGTGGSAQAVVFGLKQAGAATVTLVSRHPTPDKIGLAHALTDYPRMRDVSFDIVVNCTPVGMFPNGDQSPWPEDAPFPSRAVLYDLVYNPPVTRLMRQAQAAGAQAFGGLGMLVHQGARSFEIWTGERPPLEIMLQAAQRALPTPIPGPSSASRGSESGLEWAER